MKIFTDYQVRCKKCGNLHPKTESKYYEAHRVCNGCKVPKRLKNYVLEI
jgi:formylmethanofuran dehydrogenase subunit E